MAWSIQLDTVELNNSTYNVNKITDDTTAEREINYLKTDGIDGVVIIDDRFDVKFIDIKGVLVGSSPADLQSKIDTLNELFSRKDVNLDITPDGGSARRYVVRLISAVEYSREHYHNDFVPFRARFLVPTGIGKDTSSTNALTVSNITTERSPSPTGSHVPDFDGSAKPKAQITLRLDTIGKADLLTLTDDDTSKTIKIEVDDNFSNGDEIVIDVEQQTVENNDVEIPFRGELPDYDLGENNIHLDIQGATYVLDQEQSDAYSNGVAVGNTGALTRCLAQSFIPSESGWFHQIKLMLSKSGSPGSLQIQIYSDNGGKPYQNLVSGVSGILIPAGDVSGSATEVTGTEGTVEYYLRANTKYWLIIQTTNSSGDYYMVYASGTTDYYSDGMLLKYEGATTPPTDPDDWEDYTSLFQDIYFKTYRGQGGSPDWQIDLEIDYTPRYL